MPHPGMSLIEFNNENFEDAHHASREAPLSSRLSMSSSKALRPRMGQPPATR